MNGIQAEAQPWPVRAAILAILGVLDGVAIDVLMDDGVHAARDSSRYALATFLGIGLLAFAYGWAKGRVRRAAVTGVMAGGIVGLVFLWNGAPADDWSGGESWRIVAALLAIFIFVPMAQGAGERDGSDQQFRAPPHWSPPGLNVWIKDNFSYAVVHEHAWTNLITAGLSVLFAGAFFLMLLLVGALFNLVNVSFLKDWLQEGRVIAGIWGGAIGCSTGLLRDHRRIISGLQAVAMTVLRTAAPVLAVALALFLAILPLTGLAPLWEATRSTTPILLSAVIIALLLSSSVIGTGGDGIARVPILRGAALVLAVVAGPLAFIAAISTGLRVGQYGWTPERLWAATFVVMACIVAFAYLVAVLRGRGRWADGLRAANLHLAFFICAAALLLSTPLVRFDAIAARDQIARLNDGRTPSGKFDYRALWFEFGPAGQAAIRDLSQSGATADIRQHAHQTQGLKWRYDVDPVVEARRRGSALDARLVILPVRVPLPLALRDALAGYGVCGGNGNCTVRYRNGDGMAVAVRDSASGDCKSCPPEITVLVRSGDRWVSPETTTATTKDTVMAEQIRAGKMEFRVEPYRRLYVDGQPVDHPFSVENISAPR
ncbi:MAG TPA: DUF4153 domain-containing protein [Sphingobium sp.]|uniref:DUF4153 domain-containing protein n=1 Tax=Sphingobium sp. TaxID=1912891 RepID=UPI002ED15F00